MTLALAAEGASSAIAHLADGGFRRNVEPDDGALPPYAASRCLAPEDDRAAI